VRRNLDGTQLIPRPVWDNPRIQLLDDIWLFTIVAILVATGVPWFLSGFEVDLGRASWGLLALGAIHFVFTLLASPNRWLGRWRDRALTLLDVAGVLVVGFIWQHVGALQNPMFLLVFALPVSGAIFLSRWHPFLIAAVSMLIVGAVAMGQAPELRWFASGTLGADAWLAWLFGNQHEAPQSSFAGFYAPLNYLLVLLEVFGILLIACAVAAEYVGTIFERLNGHIVVARTEAAHGERMWADLIERLPVPALLVDPYTLRVAACSECAIDYLGAGELPLQGRNVFEVLQLSYPDVVQDLIVGADGDAPWTVIRIANRPRYAQVRVLHLAHKESRLALVTIEDATEAFLLRSALDAAEYAALVIDARGAVLAFNKLAAGLFGGMELGTDAARLLAAPDSAARWWESGITGRRKMHLPIGPRIYQITSSAVALAGEEERIFTISLLPVANAGSNDPLGNNTTVITSTTLGRLR
jgi:PAS domain-containing protein